MTFQTNFPLYPTKLPYITVSAKGMSNGLSDISNDGFDFGPDTMLNATSKGQYGPPYTQTIGIQEAINYVFNLGGGEIFFKKGIYDFTNSPVLNVTGNSTKIYIPANISDTTINIAMIGEGIAGGFWEETNANASSGNVLFVDNTTTNYNGVLFYVNKANFGIGSLNNVNFYIDNITFKMSLASGSSALALDQAGRSIIGKLYIETDQSSTGSGSNLINRTGLYLSTGDTSVYNSADTIYIQGYQYALFVGGHTHINHLILQNNNYGIIPDTNTGIGYIVDISKLTVQYLYGALIFNPNSVNFGINIDTLDIGDDISGSIPLINDSGNLSARITYHYGNPSSPPISPSPSNLIIGSSSSYELIPIALNDMYQSSTNGTTGGTVTMRMVNNSTQYKKYILIFSGYENDTTTNQTISFPLAFSTSAVISANNTGLTISTTTSGITITSPNSTTTYSGIVIVEGY